MADFNKPTDSDESDLVLELQNQKMLAIAKMDYSQYTNIPIGVIQYVEGEFKQKTLSSWEDLPITYTTQTIVADTGTFATSISSPTITTIQASITSEVDRATNAESTIQNTISSIQSTITTTQASVSTESSRAISAEGEISQDVTNLTQTVTNLNSTVSTNIISGNSTTLDSAKTYADQKVADLVGSAPAVLNTLNELANALGNDAAFSTTVTNQLGSIQGQVDSMIPPGVIWQFAGSAAPTGWLVCDGSAISRETYSALFSTIGILYGVGDSSTFNIPDFRKRIAVGKGSTDTLGQNENQTEQNRSLSHTHSIPAHYHSMGAGANLSTTHTGSSGLQSANHTHSGTTGAGNVAYYRLVSGAGAGSYGNHVTGYQFGGAHADYTNDSYPMSAHTHDITTGTELQNHSHDITHTHSSFSGSIGLVTGGVSGNASMTSGGESSPVPHLVVNYIIKT